MADLATLQTWKLEAELALHKLNCGQAKVQVTFGSAGENSSVTYTAADADKLRAYISELTSQINRLNGGPVRGPIYFSGC